MRKVQEWGALALCTLMLGGLQQVLEMTVDYVKERVQFERPVGSFQAIQFKCADMLTDIDGLRFLAYNAAWKLSRGLPATMEISLAKAWASDASRRVCAEGIESMGGAGLTVEHDIQLYYTRTKAMEFTFGDSNFHREIVAQNILTAKPPKWGDMFYAGL